MNETEKAVAKKLLENIQRQLVSGYDATKDIGAYDQFLACVERRLSIDNFGKSFAGMTATGVNYAEQQPKSAHVSEDEPQRTSPLMGAKSENS